MFVVSKQNGYVIGPLKEFAINIINHSNSELWLLSELLISQEFSHSWEILNAWG